MTSEERTKESHLDDAARQNRPRLAFIWHKTGCNLLTSQVDAHITLVQILTARWERAGFEVKDFGIVAPRSAATRNRIAELVANADLIVTFLSNPSKVEELYLSNGGILQNAKPNSKFIDLSLSTPQLSRELHAMTSVHDSYYVEAPLVVDVVALMRLVSPVGGAQKDVVGMSNDAQDKALTDAMRLFVGGETSIVEQMLPVLEALTSHIIPVGLPGAGASARISATLLKAASLMGLAEAVTFALDSNMAPSAILSLIESDPHLSATARHYAPLITAEEFMAGPAIKPFLNELDVAIDVAKEFDLDLPVLEAAHQLYDILTMVGGADMALQALALTFREEEFCTRHGINWDLAQQTMEVYDFAQAMFHAELVEEYECEDDDDDDYYDYDRGYHSLYRRRFEVGDGKGLPRIDDYFSSN